jgi:hypothetical protein
MCGQIRKHVPPMVLPAGLAVQRPGLTWGQQTLLRCRATGVMARSLSGSGWRVGTEHVDVRSPSSLTLRSSHPGLPPIIFARSQASADASGHLHSTVGKNFLQVSGTPLGGGHLHSTVGKNFLQVSGTPLGEPLWGARGHPQEPLQSVGHPLRHHQSRAHPQADYSHPSPR